MRIWKPTRWISTRWCRSSRTPTACGSPTRKPAGSSPSAKRSISCSPAELCRRPRANPLTLSDTRAAAPGRGQPARDPVPPARPGVWRDPGGHARPAGARPAEVRVHPLVVDDASVGVLRAARLPGRQRPGAGRHHAPVPSPGRRALRAGTPDQDPRAGGVGPLLPGGGRALGRARAAARRGAGDSGGGARGADLDRARPGLGDRGGDRRLLPDLRLRRDGRGGGGRRSRRRSRTRSSTRWTTSRRCRSAWRAAASW